MNMVRTLPKVIADILSYKGAEIEERNDESLDVLLPEALSKTLNIPEYVNLSFSWEKREGAIDASYESEFFASIKGLFAKGGFAEASISPSYVNLEKIAKGIDEKISFRNATFRLEKTEVASLSYLLVFFKYIAISDEKNEGILPFLVNCMNLSTIALENGDNTIELLIKSLEKQGENSQISKDEFTKVFYSAHTAVSYIIPERLKDFIKSLERRLNRDIKRVYEYYENLKEETKRAIERKVCLEEENSEIAKLNKREEEKSEIEKLQNRLNIIEAEKGLKIQDLIAQYGLSIHIEPLVVINIGVSAPIFWINIKRRLSERLFPFSYNPILKQFDPLPCESCFNPSDGYYVCDDSLHIICGHCFKPCPSCGKQYCPTCYKICPKCKGIRN